jgi:hypothetical protein
MPVVTFSVEGTRNCAVIGGTPYVYATVQGKGFVMRATCPHRDGPLHLAAVSSDAVRLVCPWHESKISVARLRTEIPAIRVGDQVTAVFPDRHLAPDHRHAKPADRCAEPLAESTAEPTAEPPTELTTVPTTVLATEPPATVSLEHRPLSPDLSRRRPTRDPHS